MIDGELLGCPEYVLNIIKTNRTVYYEKGIRKGTYKITGIFCDYMYGEWSLELRDDDNHYVGIANISDYKKTWWLKEDKSE